MPENRTSDPYIAFRSSANRVNQTDNKIDWINERSINFINENRTETLLNWFCAWYITSYIQRRISGLWFYYESYVMVHHHIYKEGVQDLWFYYESYVSGVVLLYIIIYTKDFRIYGFIYYESYVSGVVLWYIIYTKDFRTMVLLWKLRKRCCPMVHHHIYKVFQDLWFYLLWKLRKRYCPMVHYIYKEGFQDLWFYCLWTLRKRCCPIDF